MASRWLRLIGVLVIVLTLLPLSMAGAEPPVDKGNNDLQLRIFVHYPNPHADAAKGGGRPAGPSCADSNTSSTKYGTTGWVLPQSEATYYVNWGTVPNVTGLQQAIANSFKTWDDQVPMAFKDGGETSIRTYAADGYNIVAWGTAPNNAIAVTYTWATRAGQVVEVDTIMNAALPWAVMNYDTACSNQNAYDVQNILTHELGHWMGLDDLYKSAERDLTMYGYGTKGETKKDTLGNGDILGMQALY